MIAGAGLLTRAISALRDDWRRHRALYVVWLVWFIAFVLLVRSTLGGPDGTRYLAYIRSLVFDRDLILTNELERFGQRVIITSTGYSAQIANVGIIPYWLPFYLMGVLSAWLGGDIGSGMASNYQLWLDFGDWVYGLLAMLVMYRWLRAHVSRAIALASVLVATFGSSYVYYMTALAPSYHMATVLISALFIAWWDRTRSQRSLVQWFGLGLLAGAGISIAQYYGVLLAFPALELGAMVWRRLSEWRQSGGRTLGALVRRLRIPVLVVPLTLGAGLFLPLLPQFAAWGIIFGNPLANPYTIAANWSGTHFFDVLFSSYHGLFFTAPILLLACAGWLIGLRNDGVLFAGALLALFGTVYGSATRIGWWGGVSFGMRYAIGLTPLFALGLAVALRTIRPRFAHVALMALGAACALWTYGLFLQAFSGLTSFSEYHPAAQWIANQMAILRDPGAVLARHWLLPRSSALLANIGGFALISLVIIRAAAGLGAVSSRVTARIAVLALSGIPILFCVDLLATVPNNEARIAALRASGYFAKNLNRGEFDWEQFSNEYVERARYYDAVGQREHAEQDMARALAIWPNTARTVVAGAIPDDFSPLSVRFGDDIGLVGYRLQPNQILPGQPLTVTLLWKPSVRLPADYDSAVLLLDTRGEVVLRDLPPAGAESFPASWWLPGLLVADQHVIDTSTVAPATLFSVRAELFDAQADRRLSAPANGVFAEIKRPPAPVSSGTPLGTLGGAASLVASQFTRTAKGATLTLTWRADAPLERDYTVFVHLLDGHEAIVAQRDAQPLNGRYPTHAWTPGDVLVDTLAFTATPEQLARVQSIAVGMYNLADGRRLPAAGGGDIITLLP